MLITVEEGSVGGFGSHLLAFLAEDGALDQGLRIRAKVLPDAYLDHDKPEWLYAKAGLDAKAVVAKAIEALGQGTAAQRSLIA